MFRHAFFFALIVTAIFSIVYSQNISMDDFRIPESRYKVMTGNLSGGYGSGNGGNNWNESNSNSGSGNLQLNALQGFDNEYQSYSFQSRIYGSLSQSSYYNGDRNTLPPHNYRTENNSEGSSLSLYGRYSLYLVPDQTFLFGSTILNGNYTLVHSRTDTNGFFEHLIYQKERMGEVSISGGVGIGKIRNASAVFSIVRVLEKLTEDGYLTRELSKEEILALTEIFAKQVEYSYGYERPTKYFLEDLFKKLESLGVLKESKAAAYEVGRVEEILSEYIYPRNIGWIVSAAFRLARNHNEQTMDGQYYYINRNIVKNDLNNVVLAGSYGHAFSLSLQWNTELTVDVPVYGKQNRVGKSLTSALYYQVGEKVGNRFSIEYSNSNRMSTSTLNPGNAFSFTNYFIFSNTMYYYIENNVNFSIGVHYTDQNNINEFSTFRNRYTNSGLDINFGVGYRFF